MKVFGHPMHVMFIHFPVGLIPMDLVLSFLSYYFQQPILATAAFYCLAGGVITGYVALLTGLLDLLAIPRENKLAVGAGLLHGFVNGTVILVYSVLAYKAWQSYPQLTTPTMPLLLIKFLLVGSLFIGNFLGGKLIYKHHVGIQNV